jgi:hypothetical protein
MRPNGLPRAGPGCGVSRGTFVRAEIAVELAEQAIAIFFGPIGQVGDEVFNLLSSGFAQDFHATEIGRIRLDQRGVELILANQLTETIADCAATVTVPVCRL